MIDFHSHILPGVDDGPEKIEESLAMLRQSFLQGVDLVVSTSHFYANEERPEDFLRRRNEAAQRLRTAMLLSDQIYPRVVLGAEVLYFPGISDAEEITQLGIENSQSILVEPPMTHWSDTMLDEIAQMERNLHCAPVIAHVDRYMTMLQDNTLMDRVRERGMMVQVNAGYFLNHKTRKAALHNLKSGKIQVIGSDCHNLDSRPPNLGLAQKQAKTHGAEAEWKQLHQNAAALLMGRR